MRAQSLATYQVDCGSSLGGWLVSSVGSLAEGLGGTILSGTQVSVA